MAKGRAAARIAKMIGAAKAISQPVWVNGIIPAGLLAVCICRTSPWSLRISCIMKGVLPPEGKDFWGFRLKGIIAGGEGLR